MTGPVDHETPRLGEVILRRKWLVEDQLRRALRHQRQLWGRLGTCLLELQLMSEDAILQALSEQLQLPYATADDLRDAPEEALSLVPSEMACQHLLIPFRQTASMLAVAVIDDKELTALDELAFRTSRSVRPHVALEVRVQEALHRFYGHPLEHRYAILLEHLNAGRTRPVESILREPVFWTGLSPDEAPPAEPVAPIPPIPLFAEPPLPPSPAGAEPASFDALEELLMSAAGPREIAQAAGSFLHAHFRHVLLFRLGEKKARPWMAFGEDIDPREFEGLRLELDQPSVLLAIREGQVLHRGRLPDLAAHYRLAAVWGGGLPSDGLVLPIRVQGRPVCALYVDRGESPLDDEALAGAERVAMKIGIALELCLLRRKLQGS